MEAAIRIGDKLVHKWDRFRLSKKGYAVAELMLADPGLDINRALELVEMEGIGADDPAAGGVMEEAAHA